MAVVRMPLKKILAPVDSQMSSDISMGVAAALAKAMGSRVTVVHVIPSTDLPTGMEMGGTREFAVAPDYGTISVTVEDGQSEEGIIRALDRRAESIISNAKSLFAENGLEIRTDIMRFREPKEAILELGEEGWYDLIVMAKGGDDDWERPGLGEVAMGVARESKRSTLLVKSSCGLGSISVVVYPGDDGGPTELAFEMAAALGSRLSFIALEEDNGGDVVLRQLLQRASDQGLEAGGAIVGADFVEGIIENVRDSGTETLLVRRPKVGPLGRLLHKCEWVYDLLDACPSSVMLVA
jgi:nucleotide-binding universal stress UspA family protein